MMHNDTLKYIKTALDNRNHFDFLNDGSVVRVDGELVRIYKVYLSADYVPFVEYDRVSGGKFVNRPLKQLSTEALERIADSITWKIKRY